jgi:hypothetical protein
MRTNEKVAVDLLVEALQEISVGQLVDQHYKVIAKRALHFCSSDATREALAKIGKIGGGGE